MSTAVPFFDQVNHDVGDDRSPFLNFGYLHLEPDGRARGGRSSPTATSLALLHEVIADLEIDGSRVIEVGCGRGGNLRWLSRHRAPGPLVGVDLTPSSTRAAARLVGADRLGAATADALALPIAAGVADVVLSVESSCLYRDLSVFYAEVARVLRPGGCFAYADVLARDLAAALPAHGATLGLEVTSSRDITHNVVASIRARAATAPGAARQFLAWFGDRLGGSDVGYFCIRARRTADEPTGPVAFGEPGMRGAAALQDFVAEALERAAQASG